MPARLLVLLLGWVWLWPQVAGAQSASDREVARQLVAQGNQVYQIGRFDEALKLYDRAYELSPRPGTLFNIAQCHRFLGNLEKAQLLYERYLSLRPDAANRPLVERLIEELRAKLAAKARPDDGGPDRTGADAGAPARVAPVPAPGPLTVLPLPPPPEAAAVPTSPPRSSPWYRRWYVWTLVGLLVAGAAVGGAVGGSAGSALPHTAFGDQRAHFTRN